MVIRVVGVKKEETKLVKLLWKILRYRRIASIRVLTYLIKKKMIDQKMNGISLASTSNITTKQPVKNSDNIYDIICYYDENNDEESVGNVNDVINKIEKANNGTRNNNNSRYSDKSYLHWKLFGCLIINVRML